MTTRFRIRYPIGVAAAAAFLAAAPLSAQTESPRVERLLHPWSSSVGVVATYWTFPDSLFQPTGSAVRVSRVLQVNVPISASVKLGSRAGLDVSGAMAGGVAELLLPTGDTIGTFIYGPSDVRVRATVHIIPDQLLLVAMVNAPTGKTKLDAKELATLRILASPALGLSPSQVGSGFGGSAGLVVAHQVEQWALAVAGSYEVRGSYNPVAAITAGAPLGNYDPGEAVHFTVGTDGLLGQHALTLSGSVDLYTSDQLTDGRQTTLVRLGPTFGGFAQLAFGATAFRELVLYASDRYRTEYQRDGATVAGTSGNYLDVGFRSAYPLSRAVDFTLGLELHQQSGLAVDNSFATAASTSGGATLGFAFRAGGTAIKPFVRGLLGSADLGPRTVQMRGASAGLSVSTQY